MRRRLFPFSAIGVIGVLVFLAYALNFLYFFVDDEGIPFVYAQNLLGGHGLVYNPYDGPLEGYSDFLHVWIASGILAFVKAAGFEKLAVFAIGKVFSLAAGAAIVWVTFLSMRRMPGMRPLGAMVGIALLALAGPLAVWSCSSLEPALFTLLLSLQVYALLHGTERRGLALLATVLMLLCRIDGFVYIAAILGCFGLFGVASPAQGQRIWAERWRLLRSVVLPALAVFAIYQAWRIWYFGELLPMPLYSKVLHKLLPADGIVEKERAVPYGVAFLNFYYWLPAIIAAATAWLFVVRSRSERSVLALLGATIMLSGYAAIVGDWMFGFRFFVPVLPLLALLIARVFSELSDAWTLRRRVVPRVLAAVCVVWIAVVAYRFEQYYEQSEQQESWLVQPSLDPARFFRLYYALFLQARTIITPGDTSSYNQAGFIPFMLKLNNIDDLGICSKFYAKLPTTDVLFTDVGRYSPLTDKRAMRAGEAYLLYREPKYVIVPTVMLRSTNDGRVPETLIYDYYRLLFVDATDKNAVYVRTPQSVAEFQMNSKRFLENLAHVSNLKSAVINGQRLDAKALGPELPFLRDQTARFTINGTYRAQFQISDENETVREIHVNELWASQPITVDISLREADGDVVFQKRFDMPARELGEYRTTLPDGTEAASMAVEINAPAAEDTRIRLGDVRLQGQSDELAAYLNRMLRFPGPQQPSEPESQP
jgi:hypothetical protein